MSDDCGSQSSMVRAAFAQWQGRVAPVFDTAQRVRIVSVDSGRVNEETQEVLPLGSPAQKCGRLVELKVDVLVCGAISAPLRRLVVAYGIEVISFVSGDIQQVVRAWLNGELSLSSFAMPGCVRRGRRRRKSV